MDNEEWLDCADAQIDLSLPWAHMSEGMFSYIVAPVPQNSELLEGRFGGKQQKYMSLP